MSAGSHMSKSWQPHARHILDGQIDAQTVANVIERYLGELEASVRAMLDQDAG